MRGVSYSAPPPPAAYRRRRGCGCWLTVAALGSLIGGLGLVVVLLLLPRLLMGMAGFNAIGDTDAVFSAPAPAPDVRFEVAYSVPQVTVNAGALGTFTLDTAQVQAQTGNLTSGGQALVITLDEGDLLALCRQRGGLCDGGNGQIRQVSFDLRDGGGVIYADVLIPQVGIWQRIGVVMRISGTPGRFTVAGVDVGGTLYSIPPDSLGQTIREIERAANDMVQSAVLQASGQSWRISALHASDDRLTIVLR